MGDEISGNVYIVIGAFVALASLLNFNRLAFFLIIGISMIGFGMYRKGKQHKQVQQKPQHTPHRQKHQHPAHHQIQHRASYCPRCGTKVGANFNFCARCGTRLR